MELNFNANEHDPQESFDLLPPGTYTAAIVRSEQKDTKAGTGYYLQLEFQILDGVHKGRKVWDRLNLKNPNETAVKIAQAKLSSICRAVGVMTPRDSHELHDLPLDIDVVVKAGSNGYGDQNEVKAYHPKTTGGAVPRSDAPPWKR